MKGKTKTWLIWVLLILAFFIIYSMTRNQDPSLRVDFAEFRADVESGRVVEVTVDSNEVIVELIGGGAYSTHGGIDDELVQTLSDQGVKIRRGRESNPWLSVLIWIVIGLAVLALVIYFLRKSQGGGAENWMSLRKSRARQISESTNITFADVGGCDEAKELLGDVIDFLRNPALWTDAGARLPRGVLLQGPPGCGKTLLARAVAGETNARFYFVSASEFVEMFVGVGAARVRDMFETAVKNAPAVIFIDELDAVGRRRGSGIGAAHDEREQTLNQLLVCLDGFQENDRVVVIAATNRPDILDQALLRAGRIDRRIRVPELSREARLDVLQIHTANKTLGPDVSLDEWANRTEGFNGAQLENLANEAALLAVRKSCRDHTPTTAISRVEFERAITPSDSKPKMFDQVDLVLLESTTQLAEPTGKARVRLTLAEDSVVEGEIVWVDATFIKLHKLADGSEIIVAKNMVHKLEALPGTEVIDAEEVTVDTWASHNPGLA